jgi:protocatechuate 3,4-dioxygenase beta subunit
MPKHRASLRVSALAVLLLLEAVVGFAQTPATLSGTVKDPSGAVVASAVVTLMNVQTSVQTTSIATAAGAYSFPAIAPGAYKITTAAPGFKEMEKTVTVAAASK